MHDTIRILKLSADLYCQIRFPFVALIDYVLIALVIRLVIRLILTVDKMLGDIHRHTKP